MKKIIAVVSVVLILTFVCAMLPNNSSVSATAELANADSSLEYLKEKGIVNGFEDGNLYPEKKLTRAEFAKVITLAYPDAYVHQVEYAFKDMNKNHWAYEYIQTAVNAGWIKGFEDGTFRPDSYITYEQVITVLCRILNIENCDGNYPISYISAATKNMLTKGVQAVVGEELTREQMAKLLVNAMNHKTEVKVSVVESDMDTALATPTQKIMSGGGSGGGVKGAFSAATNNSMADYAYVREYNTEDYSSVDENVFKNVSTSPLSTFSIDTDTASYSNMRRFVLNNQSIPKGSIRTEELINYFDYERAIPENNKPFGVKSTVAKCPWNSKNLLAMVTVSGKEMTEAQQSNIVFLIDVSGSMFSENKLPLVKKSLGLLLDNLDDDDTISIVTYASGTQVVLDTTSASEKEKIIGVLEGLKASGSTAGEAGINLAYKQAEKAKCDGNNRVIICTDGDFNVGGSGATELGSLISEKREKGIFLSVLGFGMGNYKDSAMEALADKGNGNYAYIDTLNEAKKVLVDEMSKTIYTIAKDVKIQVEFNPEKVAQYRLIGYENRILNNEDFDNDKKDAGELGAGASVTVMYEIVPSDGVMESELKYQKSYTTGSNEMMNVKIRYKHPEGTESILDEFSVMSDLVEKTDDNFRFAAAVAELGMILNDSEHKGTATYDTVIELAENALGDDKYGLREEFLVLVGLLKYKAER